MSASLRENNKQLNRLAGSGGEIPRWWQCPGNRVKLLRRLLLPFLVVSLPLSRRCITRGALSNAEPQLRERQECDMQVNRYCRRTAAESKRGQHFRGSREQQ
ncbi:Uncharacterized protein DAT39_013046 [Clarias magur]|uniref:Uncharacterized protein n=1 Tax=Clarias magur TaxID=1594786 RepID=A0A8J4WYM2_CLAMG|nr:Uncharacterized protein DAT39_013046 [Clarias magur]